MATAIEITNQLERLGNRAVIKAVLDTLANLVAAPSEGGTPVDTGWARANWIPSIGESGRDPIGEPGNSGTASAAQQSGMAGVLGYDISQGKVYITNNVPYIGALNDGHSQQQPRGFVQRAINKALTQDIGGLAT